MTTDTKEAYEQKKKYPEWIKRSYVPTPFALPGDDELSFYWFAADGALLKCELLARIKDAFDFIMAAYPPAYLDGDSSVAPFYKQVSVPQSTVTMNRWSRNDVGVHIRLVAKDFEQSYMATVPTD